MENNPSAKPNKRSFRFTKDQYSNALARANNALHCPNQRVFQRGKKKVSPRYKGKTISPLLPKVLQESIDAVIKNTILTKSQFLVESARESRKNGDMKNSTQGGFHIIVGDVVPGKACSWIESISPGSYGFWRD